MTSLTVNGVLRHVGAGPDTPLLYALRNDLGLRGTMFGCGTGSCGACLVLIDDHATPACDTPLWAAAGKAVTTIEGLAVEGLSPVQQAFVDEQAGQCGYCIAGIIISATALLRANPDPSEQEVREALDRNLCRCGSHTRIVSAVLKAARKAL
ncbi:MAG: (2Fe-2S)-binding protein [Acidimicrobiia bacterium]